LKKRRIIVPPSFQELKAEIMDTNCLIIHNNKRLKITTSFNQKQMTDYDSVSMHMAHYFHKMSRTIKGNNEKRERNKVRAAGSGFSGIFRRWQSWRVQAEQSRAAG
jgi:hypothetical protein